MTHRVFRSLIISTFVVGSLSLTACSSNPSRQQVNTGVGAVAGGLVGNAGLGGTLGTLGGAAAGALIGNEVSK